MVYRQLGNSKEYTGTHHVFGLLIRWSRVRISPVLPNKSMTYVDELVKKPALHHKRGMCIYQTRLITPFQPHKAKTLSR